MSFDIIAARSYGTGALGDVSNPTDINAYAAVTAKSSTTITISTDNLSAFTAGTELLLHLSGVRNSSATTSQLGAWKFVKIKSVADNVLTLFSEPIDADPANWFYQAVTVPHYKNLTLANGKTISPPAFNATKGYGGVLVLKCSNKFTLGGFIDLTNKGLPDASYRPLLNQEQNGTLDTDKFAGYENYETVNHFTLNKGDGAAFIVAKTLNCEDDARIGNPNLRGVQRCRGASDSSGRLTNATNLGGSSIIIVANTLNDFNPYLISKYRASSLEAGKGLCRAYIATESKLPNDEGLYAYDVIAKPERLSAHTFINGFGSGALGTAKQPTAQQNSYAKVTAIGTAGNRFTLTSLDLNGVAKFEVGALVMIHASNRSDSSVRAAEGRFFLSTITGISGTVDKPSVITLKHSIDDLGISSFRIPYYHFQAIAIPQYSSFSLAGKTNSATPAYDLQRGGIFAIAVNGDCNLGAASKILVEGKGGAGYSLNNVSNARMKHRLPIGKGHGGVFILAKNLTLSNGTRLGASYDGGGFGGTIDPGSGGFQSGGFMGLRRSSPNKHDGYGGSGSAAGNQIDGHKGGFGGNSTDGALQGASIFIVAQKISTLFLNSLSTGGQGGQVGRYKGTEYSTQYITAGNPGGCGYGGAGARGKYMKVGASITNGGYFYGGAGGLHGGGGGAAFADDTESYWASGGGASGFCFIYCNEHTTQSSTYIIID